MQMDKVGTPVEPMTSSSHQGIELDPGKSKTACLSILPLPMWQSYQSPMLSAGQS